MPEPYRRLKLTPRQHLTLGDFRRLTEDLPDDTDFLFYHVHWKTAEDQRTEEWRPNELTIADDEEPPPQIQVRIVPD